MDGVHNLFFVWQVLLSSTISFSLVSSVYTKQMLSPEADTLLVLCKSILLLVTERKLNEGRERSLSCLIGRKGSCLTVIAY